MPLLTHSVQEISHTQGGKVEACEKKEFGHANITVSATDSLLFKNIGKEISVWMSHGDQVTKIPDGFRVVASTPTAPFAAVEREQDRIYGIQFHPEVTHTPQGKELLQNFVIEICDVKPNWTMV